MPRRRGGLAAAVSFTHHQTMPIDVPASPAGDQPRRRARRQGLLYDHAGVRDLAVDDHRFVVPAGSGWQVATFRLQLFTGGGLRPVAVITQVVPAEGAGPVNHAQRYAGAIWQRLLPGEPRPPILIGHMITDYGDDEPGDLGMRVIDFAVVDAAQYACSDPIWGGPISPDELEYLLGRPVDATRGTSRPAARRWWGR